MAASRRRIHDDDPDVTRPASIAPLCPHCGEPVDTWPDPGGGPVQTYIEDCSVCCRPLRVTARFGDSPDDFTIEVSEES